MERDQSDEENEIVENLVSKIVPRVQDFRKSLQSDLHEMQRKANLSAPVAPVSPIKIGFIR